MKHIFTLFTSLLLLLVSGAHAQQWQQRETIPNWYAEPTLVFSLGNYGYWGSILGDSALWRYDVSADSWQQMNDLPAPHGMMPFTINGVAYYMPVVNNQIFLYRYEEANDSWTEISQFPGTPRQGNFVFVIGNSAYMSCGRDFTGGHLQDHWEFNTIDNSWTQRADFIGYQRTLGGAFALNGKGYAGLGWTNSNFPEPYETDFYQYNPVTDSWVQRADLPISRGRVAVSGFSIDNRGYILGGEMANPAEWTAELLQYNDTTDSWTQMPPFPEGGQNFINTFVIGNSAFCGKTSLWEFNSTTQAIDCNPLPASLQQGLVGYWPFCGNANDESGNGNDGVVNGATLTEDRFGNSESAYEFDHSAIVTPLQGIAGNNPRSIAFWYNFSQDNSNVNSWYLVGYGGAASYPGSDFACISWPNSNNDVGVDVNTTVATYDNNSGYGSWHHFVAAYDSTYGQSVGDIKIFIDGVLQENPNVLFGQENPINTLNDITLRFGLGQNPDVFFLGSLDDIGIWNRALTPAEITSLYTGEPVVQPVCAELDPALQNGLVGYWPFCGNANDESGNGNDGVVNGATLTEDRFGNAGSAYQFNGNAEHIAMPPGSSSDLNLIEDLTVSVWINCEILAGDGYPLLSFNDGVEGLGGYGFGLGDFETTNMRFFSNGWYYFTSPFPENSEWHNFVAVLNSGTLSLYQDGSLDTSYTNVPYPQSWNGLRTLGVANNVSGLQLNGLYLNGSLDDIGIWNRALTPAEITSLYTGEPVVQPVCAALDPALQNGLVGYWPFCGNANDESGNGNDGVVNGATLTEDRFGNMASAYDFNAISSNILTTLEAPSAQNPRSFSLWFQTDSINNTNDKRVMLTYGGDAEFTAFDISIWNQPSFGIAVDAGATYIVYSADFVGSAHHHLAVTYDSADGPTVASVKVYLDGVLLTDVIAETASFEFNTGNQRTVRFGPNPSIIQPLQTFYGTLDDIGIWNRALTPAEITSLYTGEPVVQPACAELDPVLQQGLVGYWPFCGNANDESGNGNDGVVNGATLTEDRFGNPTSAFAFDGVNDYIEIIQNNLTLDTSFSISVWLNKLPNSVNRILSIERAGAPDGYQFRLGMEEGFWVPNDGQLYFHSGISGIGTLPWDNSIGYELTSNNAIANDSWQHVVVVKQGFNFLLYLNGQVQATVNLETNLSFVSNPNSILLGAVFEAFTNTTTANFLGSLDDIGIWNRALTQEEIAQLYGNFTPQVTGCTDPTAFNYNPQATVNEGCQYIATILVYNDLNGNGTHEGNEPGLTNWPVLGNDINGLVWTNSNGNAFLPLETGSYEFTVLNTTDNWVSTTPTSVTIDLTSGPATASFGLQVIPGEAIVAAGPFTGFWDILHCTEGYESGVYLENIGSQAVSGFMTLTCDPLFTPNADSYFTTPPVEVGPGYALWNVEDFQPGEYELLSFHIDGPGVEYLNQSFTFAFDLTLFDPQGNMIYSDNWTASPIVACAYDPNDITGFPEGLSAPHEEGYTIEHYILPDNMVEFRVRFQNTGTLPAEDIDIYIPIDPNQWELNTIFPLMRSAEMQVICLHDDGSVDLNILEHELPEGVTAQDLLIFSFDDIYLPDSASNPDGSQGYVYFRMQAKHTLSIGDEINAQAFIYFEQNPPIATNETYHVLFDCMSFTPMVGDTELCAGDDLQFSASQPNVDIYAWSIGSLEGSGNIFILEGIDAGEYTLDLNTKNALCPQGENHEVTIIVNDTPLLDVPLNDTVCEGEELTYEAESDGDVSWSNGASTGDVFTAEESFTVTATAVGAGGCSTSEDWTVTVNPLPSVVVDITGNVLTAQDGASWQWTLNGAALATTQSITAEESGNYQVEITSEFGCTDMSEVIFIENVVVHTLSTAHLYPNPMTTSARLELPVGLYDITLFDATGKCVRTMTNRQGVVTIERDSLAGGVYQLRISNESDSRNIRLVIE